MTRIFLALVALAYIAFGLWSLMDPIGMASQLGVNVSGPNGAFEMRGIYGGVSLGIAGICAAGAAMRDMRRPALWTLVAYMGGYCFARPIALLVGELPTSNFYSFMAFEAAILIGAIIALMTNKRA